MIELVFSMAKAELLLPLKVLVKLKVLEVYEVVHRVPVLWKSSLVLEVLLVLVLEVLVEVSLM